ncbi:MAG: outer membrane lipoprotein chaperone LolA [Betaproteobacteria bacterium]|nr:outer membrane lipoprotein chaperone LolA [Betaproteobacteria bacterium]MDH5222683.1 outer membrane lipoprotein chaperone LolA [Betaproteobacteria bacterium]MDH5349562.1 outer membrane lipoprotein chaperone LolA [Betaproteobacteria bacterium]
MRALLLALLLSVPALAWADALERFRAFVRETQSARTEFEQKVYDGEKRLVQASSGTFAFQRPGRFRWQIRVPYEQLIVGDGTRVWIHDPDLNQVTVRSMGKALGSTPAALLAGDKDVERAFELSNVGPVAGLEWLEARPRDRDSGFERIRLGMGRDGVEAMELQDHFGQTTLLQFSRFVRNPRLDPGDFRFSPPKGADVLGE